MSETYIVPCEHPDNDPDDWFIEKDGKQYPDDELLTLEEQREAVAAVPLEERAEEGWVINALEEAEAEALKDALTRRRHARDKCHVECYFRLQCMSIALEKPEPTHGTWGGYYPEELKQIRSLRDKRARARSSRDADVAAEE